MNVRENKRFNVNLELVITIVAIVGALYHLISTQFLFQSFLEHQNNHFMFSLILVFLVALKGKPKSWPMIILVLVAGIVATGYVKVFFEGLEGRIGFPTTTDIVIGIVLVLVALEASRRAFGPIIAILAIIFILYDLFGHYLPPPFYHTNFSLKYVITNLSIGLTGMYGTALGVSVNYIFLFFLFGGILQTSGAMDFFTLLGKWAGQKLRGGPAQTAVVSSALVGSVTGSAVANVAITGAFTIPLMKKVGYRPERAGAIEAAASTGGQIMPPVMGAAAFLMVGLTGIPYLQIMVAALVPALIYFMAIGTYIEFQSRASNIQNTKEPVDMKMLLLRMPYFVVPLIVLMVLLLKSFTAPFAAFWTVIALILTSIIMDFITGRGFRLKALTEGIKIGAIGGAKIGVTSAVLGFLMSSITMTGIGIKLAGMVEEWSMGILIVACVLTMLISILFGMGVPTMVAYALVAIMVVPVLLKMEVSVLQAHFFCMFFAVFSGITPPVALSALVGAQIAEASYMKTAMQAFKICIIAFILPFMIVWNPSLILQPADPLIGVTSLIAVLLAIVVIAVTITNYYLIRLTIKERILFTVTALLLISFVFTMHYALFIAGVVLFVALTLYQRKLRAKQDVVTEMP